MTTIYCQVCRKNVLGKCDAKEPRYEGACEECMPIAGVSSPERVAEYQASQPAPEPTADDRIKALESKLDEAVAERQALAEKLDQQAKSIGEHAEKMARVDELTAKVAALEEAKEAEPVKGDGVEIMK